MTPTADEITFLTPPVAIDGVLLTFSGAMQPGAGASRQARQVYEAIATLLTWATFATQPADVIDEVYHERFARGEHRRLDEDGWYAVAADYFRDYLGSLAHAADDRVVGLVLWLDTHFFDRHGGFDELRRWMSDHVVRAHMAHERCAVVRSTPRAGGRSGAGGHATGPTDLADDAATFDATTRVVACLPDDAAKQRAQDRENRRKREEAEASQFDELALDVEQRLAVRRAGTDPADDAAGRYH